MNNSKKGELFAHIREECVKDPLYLFKLLVTSFGRNIFDVVIRIAAYMAVYYVVTTYIGLPGGVAALLILTIIVGYHSLRMIIDKVKKEAKKGEP